MLAALLATCLPLMPAERGGRPELSGPEQTLDAADGRYRLHFTHSGDDAIPADDADDDGVADWAARALQALADGEQRYADEGWRLPMPDDGDGGSDAIDAEVVGFRDDRALLMPLGRLHGLTWRRHAVSPLAHRRNAA